MAEPKGGKKPDAFLSYARLDDEVSGGYISWLRVELEMQVNAEIGKGSFTIFQDTDGIAVGDHWPTALEDALAQARFLIPVLSPSYFASQPCMFELAKFHGYEASTGRKDLIIPVYFRDAEEFDNPDNPHAALLRERQFFDWRELWHEERTNPKVRRELVGLARVIRARAKQVVARPAPLPATPKPEPDELRRMAERLNVATAAAEKAQNEATELRGRIAATDKEREQQVAAQDTLSRTRAEAEELRAQLDGERHRLAAMQDALGKVKDEANELRARLAAPERNRTGQAAESSAARQSRSRPSRPAALWLATMIVVAGASAALTYAVTTKVAVVEPPSATPTPGSRPVPAPAEAGVGKEEGRAPGDTFKDYAACPEMVVVPAGSFMMGSPEGEEGRDSDEGLQHRVTIARPFAVGRYEVTFAEWDACVADSGCNGYRPDDAGWDRGRRPVISVSWEDARAYVAWLSRETGKGYRLPSEAEWEYVTRAGTTTPFWTGATISTDQANYNGNYTYESGRKGVYRGMTVPVDDASFPANSFGLYHVHGNVREWVEDCWHESYVGAPGDGSAWIEEGCPRPVLRGGSWYIGPRYLRSASRDRDGPELRDDGASFRVARMLTP